MFRRQFGSLVGVAALAAGSPVARAQPGGTLRFALGESWGSPFVERDGLRVIGGILPELMAGIAQEMGLRPELVLLPSTRVEGALVEGAVELQCLNSPVWWNPLPDGLSWSAPLLVLRDVLVTAPDGPTTAAALDAAGPWTVSVVRQYHYPKLSAAFANGHLIRDESPNQWSALAKLQRSRTQLAVVNDLTLQVYNRRAGGTPLRLLREVDAAVAHCIVSDRGRVPAASVKSAIERWIARGGVKRVLARYG